MLFFIITVFLDCRWFPDVSISFFVFRILYNRIFREGVEVHFVLNPVVLV